MIPRPRSASTPPHHLLVGVVVVVVLLSAASAGAQLAFLPHCTFQEVSLAPCMAGTGAGGGNISGACCSSLNGALDAGHRCVCSLLLANPVFASLVTNLLTLPLLLPLPGCFLFAPSLAACQAAAVQQQTGAPAASTAAVATAGGSATTPVADPPATVSASATDTSPSPNKSGGGAGPEKADGGRSAAGNGTGEAAPSPSRAGQSVGRSDACSARQGTAFALTFLTAVAVSWINCMAVS